MGLQYSLMTAEVCVSRATSGHGNIYSLPFRCLTEAWVNDKAVVFFLDFLAWIAVSDFSIK